MLQLLGTFFHHTFDVIHRNGLSAHLEPIGRRFGTRNQDPEEDVDGDEHTYAGQYQGNGSDAQPERIHTDVSAQSTQDTGQPFVLRVTEEPAFTGSRGGEGFGTWTSTLAAALLIHEILGLAHDAHYVLHIGRAYDLSAPIEPLMK